LVASPAVLTFSFFLLLLNLLSFLLSAVGAGRGVGWGGMASIRPMPSDVGGERCWSAHGEEKKERREEEEKEIAP
jgi:hypothetical protein